MGGEVMWKELAEKIREKTREGRSLSYQEGAVGITALLHCPLKWELSRRYEIDPQAVEIDDGFIWETQVKSALRDLFGEGFKEEYDLIAEFDGYKLHGHLDCFVEKEDEVIGIELKAPKVLLLKEPYEEGTLLEDDGRVIHNEVYLTQARIEKALLRRLFPEKEVKVYLFYKALCRHKNWSKKLYVVSEVKEPASEEEIKELLLRFHEDKSPRYPNECTSYCVFFKEGLCEGREFKQEVQEEQAGRFIELLKYYRTLEAELKTLEAQLKKTIKGHVVIGGKELGWVKQKVVEIDVSKLLELEPKAKEYLMVKPAKKREVIEKLGEQVIKGVEEKFVWRI